ncbi:MAG: RNA methyltransferase [Bacteroidia bacterium]|nr:RNA methyltransferase [Bacteroidia bacterium]
MLSKAVIKHLRSLHLKKFRDREALFLVEGPKMVQEVLRSGHWKVQDIFAVDDWMAPAESSHVPLTRVTSEELRQISSHMSPNKVLAVVRYAVNTPVPSVPEKGLHLLIDQVQDPGNLGTMIRIADWFGIDSVICSPDTVDLYNPKTIQATMGSVFRVPVRYTPLSELLGKNREGAGLKVYATLLEGDNLYQADLSKDAFVIMGNESRGVNPLLIQFINKSLHIPTRMKSNEHAESLNVAIATGIVCSEWASRL